MGLKSHVSSSWGEWTEVMKKAADYASLQGGQSRLHQAVEIGELCWNATKERLGDEDPYTLGSMNNLAGYYDRLGDSKKAAEIGEQCWEARKKALGERHPDALGSMSNLAGYYDRLGDSKRAAEILEQ